MNIKEVRVGESAEVFSYTRSGERISFKTKIDDIKKLTIKVLAGDISPRLTAADEFELFIRYDSEDYMWEVDNLGFEKSSEGFNLLRLGLNYPNAKISSRRAHYRLTHLVTGELLYHDPKNHASSSSNVDLVDVSAGGVAFLSDANLSIGNTAKLRFPLDEDLLLLDVNIVTRDMMPPGFKYLYRFRCKWTNLSQRVEEDIVKHIFKMQQRK